MWEILADILTVLFVINIVLITIVILMQNKGEAAGLFGGAGAQMAFGSKSGDVLSRTTGILAVSFMVIGFILMYLRASDISYDILEYDSTGIVEPDTPPQDNAMPPEEIPSDTGTAESAQPESLTGNDNTESPSEEGTPINGEPQP